jgi:hypothetical protein
MTTGVPAFESWKVSFKKKQYVKAIAGRSPSSGQSFLILDSFIEYRSVANITKGYPLTVT